MPKPQKCRKQGRLSDAERQRRHSMVSSLLAPLGVNPSGINTLVKKGLTPEKAAERLARMRKAGVPLTGLVWKLSGNRKRFNTLVERYERHGGLTEMQRRAQQYLQKIGVSGQAISKILEGMQRGGHLTLASLKEKVAFLKEIRLDPKVYGTARIPVGFYEKALTKPLYLLKKGELKRHVLQPLEDAHAEKQLDRLWAGWREFKSLKPYLPASILEKVRAAKSVGIPPTPTVVIGYSAESIRNLKAKARHSLDSSAVRKQAKGISEIPSLFFRDAPSESKEEVRRRVLVLEELVKRPHLEAERQWLGRQLQSEHGFHPHAVSRAFEQLADLGVISTSNGVVRISKWFRTGTSGIREQRRKVRQWLDRASAAKRRKRAE